ncbi:MAG TPA: lytic transglycosylase domain-containing protein [Candidatus Omnitrophota bacterium]|nr:lytic transglycosylase domain-containing protein [Candidatus Omnitrophota bacterium]
MDGSVTTVVILIFVFSILGSVTGKHPAVPHPSNFPTTNVPASEPTYDTSTTYSTVDVPVPGPDYLSGFTESLGADIRKFIQSYAVKIDPWESDTISDSILKYSQTYDVNPKLVCGLIARESRFNRFAISSSGAQGLGQLLPSTATGLGITDPFDIDQNVMGTTRYIKSLLDRFTGTSKVPFAIAGYLEGPNAVKRNNGFQGHSKSYVEDILKIANKL